jgi:hypothetical protein
MSSGRKTMTSGSLGRSLRYNRTKNYHAPVGRTMNLLGRLNRQSNPTVRRRGSTVRHATAT